MDGMNKRRLSREWSRDNELVSVRQLCNRRHRTRFWVSRTHPNAEQLREHRIRGGYCVRCDLLEAHRQGFTPREWWERQAAPNEVEINDG
jgi:hypothetical protein